MIIKMTRDKNLKKLLKEKKREYKKQWGKKYAGKPMTVEETNKAITDYGSQNFDDLDPKWKRLLSGGRYKNGDQRQNKRIIFKTIERSLG